MSTVDDNSTAGFIDYTGTADLTTGLTTNIPVSFNTYSDPVDKEAFLTEWKKLRKELLPLLLKDDHFPILNMKITRRMDPKTKSTIVQLELEYNPPKELKSRIRTRL